MRRSGPSVLDQATVTRPSIVTNGHQLGQIHPAISFGLAPAWCQYEHESMKIVALTHKVSAFTAMRSGFGPVVGLWLDYPLYLLMGTNRLKMVAPSLKKSIRGSVYPFFHPWHGHTAPISTNGHRLGKVCASPKIFFGPVASYGSRPVPVGLQAELSNLLMHIDLAKSSTLAVKNYSPCGRCPAVVPSPAGPNGLSYLY